MDVARRRLTRLLAARLPALGGFTVVPLVPGLPARPHPLPRAAVGAPPPPKWLISLASCSPRHKDADGFLYVCYSGENTFGAR